MKIKETIINVKKRAFTLIEILIVLGLAALVSAGLYLVYKEVSLTQQVREEARNIQILSSGIQSLYHGQKTYSTLTSQSLSKAGFVPDTMRKSANPNFLYSKWGTTYSVFDARSSYGPSKSFMIQFQIPKKVCEKLATELAGSFDLVRVGIGVGETGPMLAVKDWANPRVNATNILRGCGYTGSNTFYIHLGRRG